MVWTPLLRTDHGIPGRMHDQQCNGKISDCLGRIVVFQVVEKGFADGKGMAGKRHTGFTVRFDLLAE